MKNFKKMIDSLPSATKIRVTGIGYKCGFDVTCEVRDVAIYRDGRVSILNPVGKTCEVLHTYMPEIRSCEIVHERIETEVQVYPLPVWISPNEPVDDFGYPIKCRD